MSKILIFLIPGILIFLTRYGPPLRGYSESLSDCKCRGVGTQKVIKQHDFGIGV